MVWCAARAVSHAGVRRRSGEPGGLAIRPGSLVGLGNPGAPARACGASPYNSPVSAARKRGKVDQVWKRKSGENPKR